MSTQTNEIAVSSASAGALLMHDASMDRLERLAGFMASGKTTLPQHLRGNTGDCFAIALQSMQWGMNPFAVGQKTHLVNGTLGYEAQLVAAVVNGSGAVQDRFHFEWFGDWTKIIGQFKEVVSSTKKDDNGQFKKYIVPAWKQEDERGLGVKVWATIKGESQPRVLELLLTQARTRNSTLWTEDPKQQLAYLAQKRWARLHAPDVILGVYTPDELAGPSEKFMGQAEEVTPAADAQPVAPESYPQADFDKNMPAWAKAIAAGKKSMDAVIATVEAKAPLTDAQKDTLAAEVEKLKPQDVEAKQVATGTPAADAPTVSPGALEKTLHEATTLDQVYEAGGLLEAITDQEAHARLTEIFNERVAALGG